MRRHGLDVEDLAALTGRSVAEVLRWCRHGVDHIEAIGLAAILARHLLCVRGSGAPVGARGRVSGRVR